MLAKSENKMTMCMASVETFGRNNAGVAISNATNNARVKALANFPITALSLQPGRSRYIVAIFSNLIPPAQASCLILALILPSFTQGLKDLFGVWLKRSVFRCENDA